MPLIPPSFILQLIPINIVSIAYKQEFHRNLRNPIQFACIQLYKMMNPIIICILVLN